MTDAGEYISSILICGCGLAVALAYALLKTRWAGESLQWWIRADSREGVRMRSARRNLGMAILAVIAVGVLAGNTLLDHLRSPAQFAFYWLAVLLLVLWLCTLALADIRQTLRILRAWQKQDRLGVPNNYTHAADGPRTFPRRGEDLP